MPSRRHFLAIGLAALAFPSRAATHPWMLTRPTGQLPPGWPEYLTAATSDPSHWSPGRDADQVGLDTLLPTLAFVQREINSSLRWIHEFGWRTRGPQAQGNCTTAVMEKRRLLASLGLPWRTLRPTLCEAQPGPGHNYEGHAVLTVVTKEGDFVLDNLRPLIQRWDAFPYLWDSRLAADGQAWELILNPQKEPTR